MEWVLPLLRLVRQLLATLADAEESVSFGRRLIDALQRLRPGGAESSYLGELANRIDSTTFIYRQVGEHNTGLSNHYVPSAFRPMQLVNLEYLGPQSSSNAEVSNSDIEQATVAIRDSPRALFLGHAGMGKSTLLSHLTLLAVNRRKPSPFFRSSQRPVPVFVPLKVLDSSRPHPVLDYLCNQAGYRFLAGPRGRARLLRLAKAKRLLFILDGYDEVALPSLPSMLQSAGGSSTSEDSIARDINALFNGRPSREGGKAPEDITQFYFAMKGNRVWISSRRDHYLTNRLDADVDSSRRGYEPNIAAVEVLGVRNRMELIKRIFDRYRRVSTLYVDRLNEEAFVAHMHRVYDDSVTGLSLNPLFLTVMCYVYVHDIERDVLDDDTQLAAVNLQGLILKCIQLLIKDLDELKVRELSSGLRRASTERRNLYPREKLDFLMWLAAKSLTSDEGTQTFTREDLALAARTYFTSESASQLRREIVRNLSGTSGAHLTNQLIAQGLFVVVESTSSRVLYDFPHRRFRETLAAQYWNDDERWEQFISSIGTQSSIRELAIFVYETTSRNRADELLSAVLARADHTTGGEMYRALAISLIQRTRLDYDPQRRLEEYIRRIYTLGSDTFPSEVVSRLAHSEEFLKWVDEIEETAFKKENVADIGRVYVIRLVVDERRLEGDITRALRLQTTPRTRLMVRGILRARPALWLQLCERFTKSEAQNTGAVRLLADAAVVAHGFTGSEWWWRKACDSLNGQTLAIFADTAERNRYTVAPSVLGFESLSVLPGFGRLKQHRGDAYWVRWSQISERSDPAWKRIQAETPEGVYLRSSDLPGLWTSDKLSRMRVPESRWRPFIETLEELRQNRG